MRCIESIGRVDNVVVIAALWYASIPGLINHMINVCICNLFFSRDRLDKIILYYERFQTSNIGFILRVYRGTIKCKPSFNITIFLPVFSSVLGDIAGECDLAGFYMELGCTAMPNADNSTTCPEAFSCPKLHPDSSMCYYR